MSASPATFLCALSGVVPSVPVVARTSGLLFERRLIEAALATGGPRCPVTGGPLTTDDLISLQTGLKPSGASASAAGGNEVVRPRPPSATSIPGLLSLLQGEWDACMLETFHLKQQCESLKQDLAHALYKEDAATRVIARLLKEKEAAQSQLLQTEKNVGRAAASASSAMDIDDGKKAAAAAAAPASGELPESVLNILTVTSTSLSKTRKATIKEAVAAVASVSDLQAFKVQDKSHPLHATTNPGILCVDVQKSNPDLVLTGGNDGKALLFSRASGKIAAHLNGHKSAVVAAKFSPVDADVVFTASLDQQAMMWRADGAGKFSVLHTFSGARDALTSLSVHASGALVATGSKDGSWALFDCAKGSELKRVSIGAPLSTTNFHPDGVILAAGGAADGAVRVYDLKTCKLAASLKDQHTSGLTAFAFSENGFHCASADVSGVVKLWDLRKLTAFHTLPPSAGEGDKAGAIVSALSFDESSSYLAVAAGSRVLIHGTKGWEQVMQLAEHKERVTGLAWGSQARSIVSVGMDRQLKVWA